MPNDEPEKLPDFITDRKVRSWVHFAFYASFVAIGIKVLHTFVSGFMWSVWYAFPLDLWVMVGMGVSVWRYRHKHYTLDDRVPLCQDRFDNYRKFGLRYLFIYKGHHITVYPAKVTCPVCRRHEKLPKRAPTRFGMLS